MKLRLFAVILLACIIFTGCAAKAAKSVKHPSVVSGSVSQSVAGSNHDTLHFNEVSQGNQTLDSCKAYLKPIQWSDIIKEFGTNSLDDVWVPQGLSARFGNNYDDNSRGVYGDQSKTDLCSMDVFYSSESGRNPSKSVDIVMQHENSPHIGADIWSKGVVKKSQINGTDITLMHVTGNTDGEQFNGEYYSAEFTYGHIRYEVGSGGISKEEFIHVLTSLLH